MNVGSATAYFGAETQQFQAGVKSVTTQLDSLGGTYDQFGSRGARSFLMAAQGMGDLTKITEAGGASASFVFAQLSYHIGHMADQMQGAAGSGKMLMAAFSKVAEVGALAAAAAYSGWQVGRWISDITGLTRAVGVALTKEQEQVNSLANVVTLSDRVVIAAQLMANVFGVPLPISLEKSTAEFDQLKASTLRVADAIGIAVPEAVRNAEANKDGAKAVADFHNKILSADQAIRDYLGPLKSVGEALIKAKKDHDDLTHSLNAASIEAGAQTLVLKDRNKTLQAAYDAITAHVAKEKEWDAVMAHAKGTVADQAAAVIALAQENEAYVKSLISVNNLMPETSKSLEEQTRDFRLLAGAGVDAKNLLESDLAKAYVKAEEAGLNTGKKLTDSQIQLANAIKDHDIFAVQQWIDKNKEIPTSVDEAVTKATPHIDEFQRKLAEATSGTFGSALKAFRDLAETVNTTPMNVKLKVDVDTGAIAAEIQAAVDAALAGRNRSTSGSAS